ncbi:hypothetical protein BASA81_001116 [Batrachochytrium salamandrivorans]|nr:hypothetical protein BASA81_001116 [Batrachochytrium salamandrivorans]
MVLLLLLLLTAYVAQVNAYLGQPNDFWWLNTFMDGKTIGRFEGLVDNYRGIGPCPSAGDACSLNFADLPDSIKRIGISVESPFPASANLSTIVPVGSMNVYKVEVANVEFSNITFGGITNIGNTKQTMRINVHGFKASIKAAFTLQNIRIPHVTGLPNFDGTVILDKASQQDGSTISLDVDFFAPPLKTLATSFPNNSTLSYCDMDLVLGLQVSLSSPIVPAGVTVSSIISLVVALAEPLLGRVVCGAAEQLFTTYDGSPGFVQDAVLYAYDNLHDVSTRPLPNVDVEEQLMVSSVPVAKRGAAFNLGESRIMRGLSSVANSWLGAGPVSNPNINEMVNLLTMPNNGTANFVNLESTGLSVEVVTPPFMVKLDVINLTLSGLNTFNGPNGLKLLLNGYEVPTPVTPRRNYTLDNLVSLGNVGVKVAARVTLTNHYGYTDSDADKDGWLYRERTNGSESNSFIVYYDLGMNQLDVRAVLSVMSNAHELENVQLGQLLGKSAGSTTIVDQVKDALACTSKSMYGFALPFLSAEVDSLVTPVFTMRPPDAGVKTLVDSATQQILNLVESIVVQDLQYITNQWARPKVNELLRESFNHSASTESSCPRYVKQGKTTLNLLNSRAFDSIKTLIRDVIGGEQVHSNKVSINELLDQIVAFGCAVFSNGACVQTSAGKWDIATPGLKLKPTQSFASALGLGQAGSTSQLALLGVSLSGVNSVSKLLINNVANKPQGVALNFSMGTASNPLHVDLKSQFTADYKSSAAPARLDVNEAFTLRVAIENLALNLAVNPDYDLDQLYQLTLGDLTNSACIMAPLAALEIIDLSISFGKFDVTSVLNSPTSSNGNKLQLALATLSAETHSNLVYMLNTMLKNIVSFVKTQVVKINNEGGTTYYTCNQQANKFDTVFTRVISQLLGSNFTHLFEVGFGPQPAVPSAASLDAAALLAKPFGFNPYDLSTSTLVPALDKMVRSTTQESFEKFLEDTANAQGDILSDSLYIQPNTKVGLDLDGTALLPNGISLDSLLPNTTAYLLRLRVSDLSNLDIDNLVLLNPISKYVTQTAVSVPGTMKVIVDLRLVLPNSIKSSTAMGTTTTDISLALDLVDLDVKLQALTALSLSGVKSFTLGNLVTVNDDQTFSVNPTLPGCLFALSYLGGLYFPQLSIGVTSFGDIKLTASNDFILSTGTVAFVNSALELLNDFYAKDLKDITQGAVRSLVNDFFLAPNLDSSYVCPVPTPPQLFGTDRILNFQTSSSVQRLNQFLAVTLAGGDGNYAMLNSLINSALNNQMFFSSATNNQLGIQDVPIVYHKQVFGAFRGYIGSLETNNLGSISALDLFAAGANGSVHNTIQIAGPWALDAEVGFTFTDIWADGTVNKTNHLFVNLILTNLSIEFDMNVEVDIVDLMVVQASTLLDFTQLSCVATAVKKLQILRPKIDVGKIGATLSCINCDNTMLKPLNNGGELTTGNSDVLTDMFPEFIQLITDILGSSFFNKQIDDSLSDADTSCQQALNLTDFYPVFNAGEQSHLNVAVIMALALTGLGVGFIMLGPLAVPRHFQLKDRMLAEQLQAANKEPNANAQSIARFMAKQERLNIAIASHPSINWCCKCFVPVMALVNVLLLALSFTVYLAFSIDLTAAVVGDQTKVFPLVPWTISSTVNDFWNSGAQPIALIVVFMSCFWPVSKNLMLIALWFAPRTFLSHSLRMRILTILDILGKWSFVDVYIIVVLVGGLRFALTIGRSPWLDPAIPIPDAMLKIDCLVTPGVGIVILCIAAFMSLVVNHVIIFLVEKAEWVDKRLFKQINGEEDGMLTDKPLVRLAICDYVFSTSAPNGERDRFRPGFKYGLIVAGLLTFVMLIVAMSSPYFTFRYAGLIGYALLLLLEGGRARTFSLFGLVGELGRAGDGSAYYAALFAFFQILYVLTVVIAPFIQVLLQMIVWLRPMSLQGAKHMLFFSKVAAYWASMEVFAVAIVATSIEIAPVAKFLVDAITGGGCSGLIVPLSDKLGADQGACLLSVLDLEWGFPLVVIANLMHVCLGSVFIRAVAVAIRDREDVIDELPHRVWTTLEYRVMNVMFVNGAEHHKPPPKPFQPKKCCNPECMQNPFAGCSLASCCSCFKGLGDVSLQADNKGKKVGNSKWNVSAPVAQSNQWDNGSNMSMMRPSQSVNQSGNQWNNGAHNSQVVSSNPVFSMEARKPQYSVDV